MHLQVWRRASYVDGGEQCRLLPILSEPGRAVDVLVHSHSSRKKVWLCTFKKEGMVMYLQERRYDYVPSRKKVWLCTFKKEGMVMYLKPLFPVSMLLSFDVLQR